MSFVHPEMLWGLTALSIPIIIHLFNFRRYRTIYFSNVSFLRDIKEQTQTQSQLKHLLILLFRMLAITALVLAFAQPYSPDQATANPTQKVVSIYLDNSFSMESRNEDGALFDLARQQAIDIAESFSESDRFQLVTNNFDGVEQRLWTRDEFIERVEETAISNYSRNFDEIYTRQKDATKDASGQRIFFWLSDFQNGQLPEADLPTDTAIQLVLSPFEATEAQNISVDSVYFASPYHSANQPELLKVQVTNHGDDRVEDIPLTVQVNGVNESVQSVSIDGNTSEWFDVSYTAMAQQLNRGVISVEDYPISFDDVLFFSYNVQDSLSVLSIGNRNRAIESLMESAGYSYSEVDVNSIRYDQLNDYDFIFVMELDEIPGGLAVELRKFRDNGGSIAVIPGSDIDMNSYFSTASTLGMPALTGAPRGISMKVKGIAEGHPIYTGVFERTEENMNYPEIRNYYEMNFSSGSYESVITLQNDIPFLTATEKGGSYVFLFNAGLNDSCGNFVRHALFPPTLFRMVALSGAEKNVYQVLGRENPFTVMTPGDEDQPLHIANDAFDGIPEQLNRGGKVEIRQLPVLPGNGIYRIEQNEREIDLLAVNYDRRESTINRMSPESLQERLTGLQGVDIFDNSRNTSVSMSSFLNSNSGYTYYLIAFALLFLVFEIALIKLYKS
jgi:hypothetical protein